LSLLRGIFIKAMAGQNQKAKAKQHGAAWADKET